ncbi:MAG: UDP-N-acetylmuramate dehydrogenase [Verrucomicrobia bacterium]|nr:MAG: UDP-N-acetylmuramate dehydrogenase [Verrucomicrobiota bacterium]
MNTLRLDPSTTLAPEWVSAADRSLQLSDLFADLRMSLQPTTPLRRDESLARRTTLRVGGPADVFVEPAGEDELATVLELARVHGVPVFVLGRGSNLLVRDGGIRGLVVSMQHPEFCRIEVSGERIDVGAGAYLRHVANTARDAGLAGLEFLEGIPGSVGGALRMNAGAMGSWIFDVAETLRYVTRRGDRVAIPASEAGARYRGCPLLVENLAVGAVLLGKPAPRTEILGHMTASNQKRWSSQPRQPSAGCTFKNPRPDLPAGRLIDGLGLKGTRVGDAMVSDVHANFFVNLGAATARDVLALIELVRGRVREANGIELETEVEIVGED